MKVLEIGEHSKTPLYPPIEVKMDAIHRYFTLWKSIKSVSKDIGYTKIYN